ncbi:AraC family transcriptional regulator [Flavobacterium aquariorum]|uniref:AraC family transcriptional regulator n=1 Tax=Flavobacterium aquariorum TaxID=2217670 RepID=A0A2W7TW88_9FLAO|nr:AraC family transcriptional regulator [Flavobacterium aquariorum]PZX94328.1 AraC family transcriptional regulator [Flavobacterium aquariorum]
MKKMSPTLEIITPSFGSSFTFSRYVENANCKSDLWHYHPEIELVFVNGGSGKRQIGSHISYYSDGDLVLIGSNLPHCGFTNEQTGNKNEIVIQMPADFLGSDFLNAPELKNIQQLFKKAKGGIAFGKETINRIAPIIEEMEKRSNFDRLLRMIRILNDLGVSDDYTILNADGFSLELQVQDNDRINVVFNYVKDHFQEPIQLDTVSNMVSMTTPSFCRYFKKITNKTFTTFVNDYRLVHASKLLSENTKSITEICYESGFNNFSHFNKSFKAFTGKSASQYRHELKSFIE